MILLFWLCLGLMLLIALGAVFYPLLRASNRPPKLFLLLLALCLCLSFWIYMRLGSYDALKRYWLLAANEHQVQQVLLQMKTPQAVIAQLQDHLQRNPKSAEGWYLLGKLYLAEGQFVPASQALARAAALAPASIEYQLAAIESNFVVNHNRLSPEDAAELAHILKRDPQNANALNVLALDAYFRQHDTMAIFYWEQLLALLPTDSPDAKNVLKMIAQAQHIAYQIQRSNHKVR